MSFIAGYLLGLEESASAHPLLDHVIAKGFELFTFSPTSKLDIIYKSVPFDEGQFGTVLSTPGLTIKPSPPTAADADMYQAMGLSYTGKSCSQAIFALIRYEGEYVFCFAQSPLENLWRGQRDWYWLNDEVYFYDRNQASIYSATTSDTITASDFTIAANSYGAQYCDFSLFYKTIAVTFVRDLVQHYIRNSSGDHIYTTQPEFERYFYRETLVARNYNVRVYPFSANNLIDHVFDSTLGLEMFINREYTEELAGFLGLSQHGFDNAHWVELT